MIAEDRVAALRFVGRSAAAAGATLGLYAALDGEVALSPSALRHAIDHKWIGRWADTLCRIFGVRVHGRGPFVGRGERYPSAAADGVGRVFVMNHRSAMDIPVTLATTVSHVVSRADLARWPVIGAAARRAGTLFVDRASRASGATVIMEMVKALEQGCGVALYPEGTAYPGDEVRPLKRGAFDVALRTGAEIVPMGIAYADPAAAFGDESFPDHIKRVAAMDQVHAFLEVGDPIPSRGRDVEALRVSTRARLQQLVERARDHALATAGGRS